MLSGLFREPASTWTHLAGLVLALAGAVFLLRRSGSETAKLVVVVIYGIGLVACYAASSLFHGVQVPPARIGWYARLDSIGIFALIAGSYTPIAWTLMRGPWRTWTLASVWLTAGVAIVLLASGRHFSPMTATSVYLVMGWGVVICLARIARVVPARKLWTLIFGGLLYSLGAVLNLLHWPALWPDVFGTHALFHLFVIAGSAAHFWFILKVCVPYSESPESLRGETTPCVEDLGQRI